MAKLPLAEVITNNNISEGEMKQAATDTLKFISQLPGGSPSKRYTLTVDAGDARFTPAGYGCILDLPDGVDEVNLSLINPSEMEQGNFIEISSFDPSKKITIKNKASGLDGSISTLSGKDLVLTGGLKAEFELVESKWQERSASGKSECFVKPVRGKPLLEKASPTSVIVPAGLSSAVDGKPVTLDANITLSLATDLVGSTAVPGTDYFVYLRPDATAYISASDVELDGRLIGGFHYGLTGHAETPSGNKTKSDMVKLRGINAHTFWDLTWRANKHTNRGLTFDGIHWIDIYLADEEYAVRGWSKAGGWIAGGTIEQGRKFPIIPEMFGGNGSATYGKLTPYIAWDMLNAAGMEPINYKQFSHAMYGVEEGLPASGIETVIGKIEHYPRLTSRYGVEQATGVQWIWGADLGSSSSDTWNNIADSRGQVYSGVNVSLYGAYRANAVGLPGSRASAWSDGLTHSSWHLGVRGLRDHLTLD